MTDNGPTKNKYDLEEQTGKFGEDIIKFAKQLPQNVITKPLISQLIEAATRVGANYAEADDAKSKKDFIHKIGICKKEARETKHWLRMMVTAVPEIGEDAKILSLEAKELNLIFNAIIRSAKK